MYKEFEKIYDQRPFKENIGGLNFYGMYSLWNILNILKPKYVIESGVWKGCSTWIIDNIDSVEKIICIDPLNKNWYPDQLLYTSKKAEYLSIDFLEQNFENINLSECVVFFDDHQDILPRLLHCKKLGICNIIMDDNYRTTVGSHVSLYCLQNLVFDDKFKEIEIEKEINYYDLEKNENIEDNFHKEMINNNFTYIKIKQKIKKTIGLSLFGYGRTYERCYSFFDFLKFLMINIRAYKSLYEEWDIYLAVDNISYANFKELFDYLDVENLINLDVLPLDDLCKCMLWRYRPNSYSDYMISRDIDALPTYRERQAVQIWLNCDKNGHSIHDHPQHMSCLMGGMVGLKKNIIDFNLIELSNSDFKIKGADQEFLYVHVYPLIKNSIVEHNIRGLGVDKLNLTSFDYIENIDLGINENLIESNKLVDFIGQAGFNIENAKQFWNKNGKKEIIDKLIYLEKKFKIYEL